MPLIATNSALFQPLESLTKTQKWMRQLSALMHKNWLFSRRRILLTSLQLLAPLIFIALLISIDKLPKSIDGNPYNPFPRIVDQPTFALGAVQKCREWSGQACKTIRYTTGNTRWWDTDVELLMPYVAQECDLSLELDFERMPDEASLIQHFKAHPNTTTNGLIFEYMYLTTPQVKYTIMFNATSDLLTMLVPSRKPDNRNELQIAVDKAIVRFHSVQKTGIDHSLDKITYSTRLFPSLGFMGGKSSVDNEGPVFFYCGVTFTFVILLYNICAEKELRLRQGLKMIGLQDSVYWIHWLLTGFVMSAIVICVLLLAGYVFGISMFVYTTPSLNFVVFGSYALASIGLVLLTSVFVGKTKSSLNAAMLHFILGLLLVAICGKPTIKQTLNNSSSVWPWVPTLLSFLFPAYNLGESLCEINYVQELGSVAVHRTFDWGNVSQPTFLNKSIPGSNGSPTTYQIVDLPNVADSIIMMLLNFIIFSALAIYFDQVLPGPNGEPRVWYFFLLPSYWGIRMPNSTAISDSRVHEEDKIEETDSLLADLHDTLIGDDVMRERSHTESGTSMLQIRGLFKKFQTRSFLRRLLFPKPAFVAVNNLWLSGEQGEVLTVLGRNGAGKTTTIKMLTGLLNSDAGDAVIDGLSINTSMSSIRPLLGVCPQHDVLWPDLTAREHIRLFGALKNVVSHNLDMLAYCLLSDVGLSEVVDRPVETYSGGMKRRLSVALSFIGNPKIVILDEPTTGTDPYVRREIWNLILRMRPGRVIVMTTHSMQEADVLGDKVALMEDGSLKVVGTSTGLKNRFAGYLITVAVESACLVEYRELVKSGLPLAVFEPRFSSIRDEVDSTVDTSYIAYTVPPHSDSEIVHFLQKIEDRPTKLVVDLSVTQTSLEEVFISVAADEDAPMDKSKHE